MIRLYIIIFEICMKHNKIFFKILKKIMKMYEKFSNNFKTEYQYFICNLTMVVIIKSKQLLNIFYRRLIKN